MSTARPNGSAVNSTGTGTTKEVLSTVVKKPLTLKGKGTVAAALAVNNNKRKREEASTESKEKKQSPNDTSRNQDDDGTKEPSAKRTKAEEEFRKIQQAKMAELAAKRAQKSHRENIEAYNEYLSKLSEHHDIPKVGPG